MNAKAFLQVAGMVTAVCLLVLLGYFVIHAANESTREYNERREHRRELVRECVQSGGTPVITQSDEGRLTGYYGCTKP